MKSGKIHTYKTNIRWEGNLGNGTANYQSYSRDYVVQIEHKSPLFGSSDAAFRGDYTKYNPEDLFLTSVSACHMLWYLHLCAEAGVVVTDYQDNAIGKMEETASGSGKFVEITLFPRVTVADNSMIEKAKQLHQKANALCFIANSLGFPVHHEATILV